MNKGTTDNTEPLKFNDDETYLRWTGENPTFFVLNSNKSLTPRHTVIHRADCRLITRLTGKASLGGFTRSYIKVGATSPAKLRDWAKRQRVDAETRECTKCARNNALAP